ncbi:papilin isoform X1 [Callorhinchus milii]|uniref:papilin isoform X1 n=1 Tax=Callorhinchus milii TaxID=7868 RepID=UPI0004575326|nr:papilin isoform X1 [Callorhinchus milii]|eukprot:gi/632951679/ref/XP_007891433.1/ PREDICTED: papilin isoform X3 [Callorhinchus milii]
MKLAVLSSLVLQLLLLVLPSSSARRKKRQSDYWGPWGAWGECSRTCGIGVSFHERRCFSYRRDGGSNCIGPSRNYRSCNIQDCPEGSRDFREEQCSEFDGNEFQGKRYKWLPYYGAPNKCELNCIPKGENFYYRHREAVRDGTLCEPGNKNICIEGVCKLVGCDNTLDSSQTEDKCLECGGDGSSCYEVKRIFNANDLPIGYNQIFIIPIGATSIRIREVVPTRNFLAIKNVRSEYYLNGHWTIDFSRALYIANTVIHYERGSEGDLAPEVIHGRGPTSEPLVIEIISQELNQGVEYEYFLPRYKRQPQGYFWSFGSWSSCSKECGGGYQTRLTFCTIDSEAYPDQLCQAELRPISNKTCNIQLCPQTKRISFVNRPRGWSESECQRSEVYRWKTGDWGMCSVTCGGGVQTRSAYCTYVDRSGAELVADVTECVGAGGKPQSRRACNLLQCAAWIGTQWSECSVTCGEGIQTRSVSCMSQSGSQLPAFACSSQLRPSASQACVLSSCTEAASWYIEAWGPCSVSCGEGIQTRSVSCMSQSGSQRSAFACSSHPKPSMTQSCVFSACSESFSWYIGTWGLCSKSCASGRRKRQVLCYDQDLKYQLPELCNLRARPHEIEECNTQPCFLPQDVPSMQDPTGFDPDREIQIVPFAGGQPSSDWYPSQDYLPGRRESNQLPSLSRRNEWERPTYYHFVPESDYPTSGSVSNPSRPNPPQPRQELLAPSLNDCTVESYGCCPDGFAPARGPGGQGCPSIPCYKSRYGCCPDGVTSAKGADHAGCPRHHTDHYNEDTRGTSDSRVSTRDEPSTSACRGSTFGCCHDQSTSASGPTGEGCRNVPHYPYPIGCLLPSANGPCADWMVRWFFIANAGVCNRFWYGGCHGNKNNFQTEEECLRKCKGSSSQGVPVSTVDGIPQSWLPHIEETNQREPLYPVRPGASINQLPVQPQPEQTVYRLNIERRDPSSVDASPGQTAKLLCRFDASPSQTVEWRKDGRTIYSTRHTTHSDGSLVISRVTETDAGLYTCHVSNGRDQDFRHVKLNVQAASYIRPDLSVVEARVGFTAQLPCRAEGVPRPEVFWERNGARLGAAARPRLTQLDDYSLRFTAVVPGDAGEYICVAHNNVGPIQRKVVQLKVKGELKITLPPEDLHIREGRTARFPCVVSGNNVTVRWTRNGIPLQADGQHIYISRDGTLVLSDVQREDSGTYTCNAYSGSHSVSANADLTVTCPYD